MPKITSTPTDAAAEWKATLPKTGAKFKALAKRSNTLVPNCALPTAVKGFVEGEDILVLHTALRNRRLRPIAMMETGSKRDVYLPGSYYVYFRIMYEHEEANTMAFNSVGSALIPYRVRMVFKREMWEHTRGGYVSSIDGKGAINSTPFSQEAQTKTFAAITPLGNKTRGSAEIGIYSGVSMEYLESAWCLFPYSKSELESASPLTTSQSPVVPTPSSSVSSSSATSAPPSSALSQTPAVPTAAASTPQCRQSAGKSAAVKKFVARPSQPSRRAAMPRTVSKASSSLARRKAPSIRSAKEKERSIQLYQSLAPCFSTITDKGAAAGCLNWICFENYIPGSTPIEIPNKGEAK